MASTNPQDRLNRLFDNSPLPSAPTPGELHFSEKELEDRKATDEQRWKLPSTAEYPRKIQSPPKNQPQRDLDILTSSDDDDDYVSSFKKKPSMKPPTINVQPKRRAMPQPNAFGYPAESKIEPKAKIEYLAKGKPSQRSPSAHVDEYSDDDDDNATSSRFCQFTLVAKFPYKYMNDANDRVSRHFFASSKFYDREWALHYLHPPFSLSGKPIILVPFAQVQQLITEIGETFKVSVSVPKFPFTLSFHADGTPEPVFLGKSNSRDEANNLQSDIPAAPLDHGECPDSASSEVRQRFEDFKVKCQDAISAAKGRGKGAGGKKKREDDRLLTIKDWYAQLRRGQRYLGLRRKTGLIQNPDPGMSWEEQEIFRRQQLKKAHFVLEPLDLGRVAPFPFEKEPIIVSIDVESYERAHNLITEIGISTLDTLDLVDIAPGLNGKNWTDQIRSRHFRISGRENLVNRDFCIGHPEAFEFGKSEWVDLKEAVTAVDSCFEWPFSVQYKHASVEDMWDVESSNAVKENKADKHASNSFCGVGTGPTNAEQDAASRAAIASVLYGIGNKDAIKHAIELTKANQPNPENLQRGPKKRNIILLGHDVRTDVDYLRDLGSEIFKPSRATYPMPAMELMADGGSKAEVLTSLIDSMDTAPLYRVLNEEAQNRSLSSIMSDLGLPCNYAHNGGNDARYTLEAWVAMLIKARLKGDEEQKEEDKNAERHLQMARDTDSWNEGSEWGIDASKAAIESHQVIAPDGDKRQEDLDAFEAAVLGSSPEASPPRQKDETITAMAERLKLDPTIDDEEPKHRFR